MKILIMGINKADLLLNLYNNATFGGEGFKEQPMLAALTRMAGNGNIEKATGLIDKGEYKFDYIDLGAGERPLKVNLSGFDFDSTCYDQDHGVGQAEKVVTAMRNAIVNEAGPSSTPSLANLLAQVSDSLLAAPKEAAKGDDDERKELSP